MGKIREAVLQVLEHNLGNGGFDGRIAAIAGVIENSRTCYSYLLTWTLWCDLIRTVKHLGIDLELRDTFHPHTKTTEEDIRFTMMYAYFDDLLLNTTEFGGNAYGMWLSDRGDIPIDNSRTNGLFKGLKIRDDDDWNEFWLAVEEFLYKDNETILKEINGYTALYPPMEQMEKWYYILRK